MYTQGMVYLAYLIMLQSIDGSIVSVPIVRTQSRKDLEDLFLHRYIVRAQRCVKETTNEIRLVKSLVWKRRQIVRVTMWTGSVTPR